MSLPPNLVGEAYHAACLAELAALKPGNVHRFAAGHGMGLADFETSAAVSAAVISRPELSVGQKILEATRRTKQAVGCNTNLGILLLAAALAQAAQHGSGRDLRRRLAVVLARLNVEDAKHAFAAIRLARLAMPTMADRKWGRIINVLSGAAKTPGPRSAPTSVSRAAGMALTKVLAGEGAPDNILVNALLVGIIRSGQHERRHQANAPEKSFEEFIAPQEKQVPLGRIGDAEEFANMACFLVSDAGSYVTGCAINVDGGRSPVV